MELHVLQKSVEPVAVLLDDDMEIIKPVYEYLRFLRRRGRAENTLRGSGKDLKVYWEFLEKYGYSYDSVTPNMIADLIDYLRKGDIGYNAKYQEDIRSGATINRILSTVRMFYQYHAELLEMDDPILMSVKDRPYNRYRGILYHFGPGNRVSQFSGQWEDKRCRRHLVTEEEMNLFLSFLEKKRDILLYKLMYLTGARIQEALDLKIESVPKTEASERIGIFPKIKSKGKRRDLYVPMSLIAEFNEFIETERKEIWTEHTYLFVVEQDVQRGRPLTYKTVYDKLKTMRKKTGMYFTFHDLRHSFCSRLAQSGMDMNIIRVIMGHERISTTQRYTHLSQSYIKDGLSSYWEKEKMRTELKI